MEYFKNKIKKIDWYYCLVSCASATVTTAASIYIGGRLKQAYDNRLITVAVVGVTPESYKLGGYVDVTFSDAHHKPYMTKTIRFN